MYVYAAYTGSRKIEARADELLDYILENVVPKLSSHQLILLCQIGCGLLYLFRNGLVDGEEEEVLEGVDRYLEKMADKFPIDTTIGAILAVYRLKRKF